MKKAPRRQPIGAKDNDMIIAPNFEPGPGRDPLDLAYQLGRRRGELAILDRFARLHGVVGRDDLDRLRREVTSADWRLPHQEARP